MIQYKNGRLHIPGISFSIPEGFFFYTDTDFVSDNTLHFLSPDKKYRLDFQATSSICGDTAKDMSLMIAETGGHVLQAPTSIIVNGIKGHYALYRGGDELYYELRLQNLAGNKEYEQLILLIICSTKHDIQTIASSDTILPIIAGINPESNAKPET